MPQNDIKQTYKSNQFRKENVAPKDLITVEFLDGTPADLTTNTKRVWVDQITGTMNMTIDGMTIRQLGQAQYEAINYNSGRRWCFLGDSITNGSSATNFDYSYTRMATSAVGHFTSRLDYIEAGVPGERSDQAYARMNSIIAMYNPSSWVVLIGTNDASQLVTPEVYWSWLLRIIRKVKQSGASLVVCTVPPRGSGTSSDIQTLVNAYNVLIRLYQNDLGYEVAEVNSALIDPSTGYLSAAYDSGDGVHPNDYGHREIAKVVGPAMKRATKFINKRSILQSIIPATTGLITTDPLNARANPTTSPWYEVPGGTGTEPTYSMVSDTSSVLAAGRWAQMDFDATVGGVRTLATVASSGFSEGDVLMAICSIQVEDVSGTWENDVTASNAGITVSVRNQADVAIIQSLHSFRNPGLKDPSTGFYDYGQVAYKLTVPEGVTDILYNFRILVPTGKHVKLRVGEVGILNLTTMNLADVITEGETFIGT